MYRTIAFPPKRYRAMADEVGPRHGSTHGKMLTPPPLQLEAAGSVEEGQRQETDWAAMNTHAEFFSNVLDGGDAYLKQIGQEGLDQGALGPGLSMIAETAKRMEQGEAPLKALRAGNFKAGLEWMVDDVIENGYEVKSVQALDGGRTASSLLGTLLETTGKLGDNQALEDTGKVLSLVGEMSKVKLAKKVIVETTMVAWDMRAALRSDNPQQAVSDLNDQLLSGAKGDVVQGFAIMGAYLTPEGRAEFNRRLQAGEIEGYATLGRRIGKGIGGAVGKLKHGRTLRQAEKDIAAAHFKGAVQHIPHIVPPNIIPHLVSTFINGTLEERREMMKPILAVLEKDHPEQAQRLEPYLRDES